MQFFEHDFRHFQHGDEIIVAQVVNIFGSGALIDGQHDASDAVFHIKVRFLLLAVAKDWQATRGSAKFFHKIKHHAMGITLPNPTDEAKHEGTHVEIFAKRLDHRFTSKLAGTI